MNERIRELAEQASHQSPDGYPLTIPYSKDFAKKFAQLIIAECCVALHPMLRDMISRTQAVDMIVTHFKDQE